MSEYNKQKRPKYTSINQFYPVYLSEHQNTVNRTLHFMGTALMVLSFITAMLFHAFLIFTILIVTAFCFQWIGHFFFEKNKPSTFKYLFYNLGCDFLLFGDIMMGSASIKVK